MVESQPSKLLVAGSIPVSRSNATKAAHSEPHHSESRNPVEMVKSALPNRTM